MRSYLLVNCKEISWKMLVQQFIIAHQKVFRVKLSVLNWNEQIIVMIPWPKWQIKSYGDLGWLKIAVKCPNFHDGGLTPWFARAFFEIHKILTALCYIYYSNCRCIIMMLIETWNRMLPFSFTWNILGWK